MVRSYTDQLEKYSAKYSGENVRVALTAIKDTVMDPRYEVAISVITQDREVVRRILTEMNVPVGKHGIHYAFAFALSSAKFSHSGRVLASLAMGLKERFVALGASPEVCDAIIEALIGVTPYY